MKGEYRWDVHSLTFERGRLVYTDGLSIARLY